ncbi:unnamed protein product, partial [Didymodactylos carnosus]
IGQWYQKVFSYLKQFPRYLIPPYFDAIISGTYTVLIQHAWKLMTPFIQEGSSFIRALAMGSVQLCGHVRNARLPLLSPNLTEPKPSVEFDEQLKIKFHPQCPSLSSGLPNFTYVERRDSLETI